MCHGRSSHGETRNSTDSAVIRRRYWSADGPPKQCVGAEHRSPKTFRPSCSSPGSARLEMITSSHQTAAWLLLHILPPAFCKTSSSVFYEPCLGFYASEISSCSLWAEQCGPGISPKLSAIELFQIRKREWFSEIQPSQAADVTRVVSLEDARRWT